MGKKESGTEVAVPDNCYEVKAWYPERPTATTIREIKDFVMLTGQPFMWPGHTHTKPRPADIPIYLDEFELPEKFTKLGYFAPCPCCRPRHGKFGKGKIAWFPEEGVIRLIGPDCFASLNKEAHETALIELRQRKQREADVAYLLKNHARLCRALAILKAAQPVIAAIQHFSKSLRETIDEKLNLPLWSHVQHGHLPIWESFTEVKGDGTVAELTRSRTYAPILGYKMLKPDMKSYDLLLRQVVTGLTKALEADDWDDFIGELSDKDRHNLAKLISGSIKRGRDLLSEGRDLQQFVSQLNLATMRKWGLHPNNPMPMIFEREGSILKVGKTDFAKMRVAIPAHLEDDLPDIDVPLIKEFTGHIIGESP